MLIASKKNHKKQLALMAGLTLSTMMSSTVINASNADPQLLTQISSKINSVFPGHILGMVQVHASVVTNVPKNSYGIDVSDYQRNDMGPYARAGAKFVIIKLSEGYYPGAGGASAGAKVRSAIANNMMVMGYHFYHYNGSTQDAIHQANVAINAARRAGVPEHSYIALDWESENGRGQNCGSMAENTAEALAWMQTVRNAGYLPMLYSGSAYLKAHFNRAQILQRFPGSFWVAQYPYSTYNHPSWQAPMDSFPSMDGVAIWQFSNDMYGMNTDGNINVLPLQFLQPANPGTPVLPAQAVTNVRFIDDNGNGKVVSTQTVHGTKGSKQNINIPANYNGNNQITNNGGTVDVHLTHKTQSVTQNKNITYTVDMGSWVNVPNNVRPRNSATIIGPVMSHQVNVTQSGTKDLVTGQTKWNDIDTSQYVNKIKNDIQSKLPHYATVEASGNVLKVVKNYNQMTPDERNEVFENITNNNSGTSSDNSSAASSDNNSASSDNSSAASSDNNSVSSDNSSAASSDNSSAGSDNNSSASSDNNSASSDNNSSASSDNNLANSNNSSAASSNNNSTSSDNSSSASSDNSSASSDNNSSASSDNNSASSDNSSVASSDNSSISSDNSSAASSDNNSVSSDNSSAASSDNSSTNSDNSSAASSDNNSVSSDNSSAASSDNSSTNSDNSSAASSDNNSSVNSEIHFSGSANTNKKTNNVEKANNVKSNNELTESHINNLSGNTLGQINTTTPSTSTNSGLNLAQTNVGKNNNVVATIAFAGSTLLIGLAAGLAINRKPKVEIIDSKH